MSSDDEQQPLIVTTEQSVHYKTYNNLSSTLDALRTDSNSNTDQRLNACGHRISYSWSNLNAYVHGPQCAGAQFRKFLPFRKATYSEHDGPKQILKNVTGIAYPGELLAILGASGAGKTTLLNALTYQSAADVQITGLRCLNAMPVNGPLLTSQSAYVQQEDLFVGSLTVKEHLQFQALVRMDRHVPYKQRMKRVDEVIAELGLKQCTHTQIGVRGRIKGISGGEMKRLSFASEVLTDPALMFCDEPTSGLDSFMAHNVVLVLKGLARKGKTIVSTIHQPSSEVYALFDKVLLLAQGRVAFLGTPLEAAAFFANLGSPCPRNYNPADYYIQLLAVVPSREESCRQAIDLICNEFQASDVGVGMIKEASTLIDQNDWNYSELWTNGSVDGSTVVRTPYKASWWAQFRALLWRSWLGVVKEPLLIKVRVLQTILVALLIGIIFFGQRLTDVGVMNIDGAIFITLTNTTFQNMFAVITVFCSELPVFLREHRNGMYRVDVYFLCKTLAETPLFLVVPALFMAVLYYMVGLNPSQPRYFVAMAVLVLVANVATSFGYVISCVSSNESMAVSIGPPIIVPLLLFGGFFLNAGSVPVYFKWISKLSWFRYGNEALLINQWSNVSNITCTHFNSTCPQDGHIVLKTLGFSEDNFLMDLLGLALLIIGFRLLAFLALLSKTFSFKR